MKYLLIAFGLVCLVSCHDLHQKMYDTFHGKKDSVAKDSTVKVRVDSSSTIKFTSGGKNSVTK
jgi:hypothetical protein